jgi:hypothetical protein
VLVVAHRVRHVRATNRLSLLPGFVQGRLENGPNLGHTVVETGRPLTALQLEVRPGRLVPVENRVTRIDEDAGDRSTEYATTEEIDEPVAITLVAIWIVVFCIPGVSLNQKPTFF